MFFARLKAITSYAAQAAIFFGIVAVLGYGYVSDMFDRTKAASTIRGLVGEFSAATEAQCGDLSASARQAMEKAIRDYGDNIPNYGPLQSLRDLSRIREHGIVLFADEAYSQKSPIIAVIFNNRADKVPVLAFAANRPENAEVAIKEIAGQFRNRALLPGNIALYRPSPGAGISLYVLPPEATGLKFRLRQEIPLPADRCAPAVT